MNKGRSQAIKLVGVLQGLAGSVVSKSTAPSRGSKAWWGLWAPHIAVACILVVTTSLVLYKAYGPRPCERRRALFFVEAQGVRLDVSKLDICKKQLVQRLASETLALPELQKNFQQKGHWDILTLERALQALRKLRGTAIVHKPHDLTGVVMPEFHKLANLEGFINAARDMPELKLTIFLAPSSPADHSAPADNTTTTDTFVTGSTAEATLFFNESLWPRDLYL